MAPTREMPNSPSEARHAFVEKWWQALHRSIFAQLACSVLMQVSYVAFPAYNFALALWCLVCCTPKWFSKNPRLLLLVIGALAFSEVTDIVWISLWVSGRVFYDQFCGQNGVSIISCGGASDYFPGCSTNRFSLFAMLMNDVAKVVAIVCIHRIHSLQSVDKKHGVASSTNAAVSVQPRGDVEPSPPLTKHSSGRANGGASPDERGGDKGREN